MPKAASLHVDEEQDAPILRAFDAWEKIMDRAIAEVEAAGELVAGTTNGNQQKIPQLNVLADATKQVLALAQQLGRTPASRIRLGADTEQEEDDDSLDLPPLPVRGPQPVIKPASKPKPRAKPKPKPRAKPKAKAAPKPRAKASSAKSPTKRGKRATPPS